MDGYITTQDAAEELGVSIRRVQALIASGRLPAQRVGSGVRAIYLIARADLDSVRNRKPGRPGKAPAAESGGTKKRKPTWPKKKAK